MTLSKLVLLLVTMVTVSISLGARAESSQQGGRILECMQPVNIDDPNFEQGKELFFDILFHPEKGITVVLTTGTLQKEVLFESKDTMTFHLDQQDRSLAAEWSKPQNVRLVARQFSTRWYGEFWFPERLKSKLIEVLPGRDLQISCVEKGILLLGL